MKLLQLVLQLSAGIGMVVSQGNPAALNCPDNFVACVNGTDVLSNETCKVACGGGCCFDPKNTSNDPCSGFTGSLCKGAPTPSCTGSDACVGATIQFVKESCNGEDACNGAGANIGTVEIVEKSCIGDRACMGVGYNGGTVKSLDKSCNGEQACKDLANTGGRVDFIDKSCIGARACMGVGYNRGTVKSLDKSCNGEQACEDLANTGGRVDFIQEACNGTNSCNSVAMERGRLSSIYSSCIGTSSCHDAARYQGNIRYTSFACTGTKACQGAGSNYGDIFQIGGASNTTKACDGNEACSFAAKNGGTIRNITNSCTGNHACASAAAFHGVIEQVVNACHGDKSCHKAGFDNESGKWTTAPFGIAKCCDGTLACESVTQATLPSTCGKIDAPQETCTRGFIKCKAGMEVGTNLTCKEACSGDCCVDGDPDGDACSGFTGSVCKDGSCSGPRACVDAVIGEVTDSCLDSNSCEKAGSDGGNIRTLYKSCKGFGACNGMARWGGNVTSLVSSCLDTQSCSGAASGVSSTVQGGTFGDLTQSCLGFLACEEAGKNGGSVTNLVNSCIDYQACRSMATNGTISKIHDSCIGENSCREAATSGIINVIEQSCRDDRACYQVGGNITSIAHSCLGKNACYYAAYGEGSIGNIISSCYSESACESMAFGNTFIGQVENACKGNRSCYQAGDYTAAFDIELCCNGASVCEDMTKATLPSTCGFNEVYSAPTNISIPKKIKVSTPASATLEGVTCTAGQETELRANLLPQLGESSCPPDSGSTCEVIIKDLTCQGVSRSRRQFRRGLQSSSLLVNFETIVTAYCLTSDCSDADVIALAVYETVQETFKSSIADNSFVTGLSASSEAFSSITINESSLTWQAVVSAVLEISPTKRPTNSPTKKITSLVSDFWYPDYDTSWPLAGCSNKFPLPFPNKNDRPSYSTQVACCKSAYAGQVSGKCLSQLASPPTTSPTTEGGMSDFWYPDYDTSWSVAGCSNKLPLPYPNKNDRPNYSTQVACCKGAYAGQVSGKCLSQLASPPTTSPTGVGGLDYYYPDYDTAWSVATCKNDSPRPFNKNDRPTYDTMLACCKGAYAGQQSGTCLAGLASPPTVSPTKMGGGLDVYYPDYTLAWPMGVCINNAPIPSGRPTYSTKSACCGGAYGGQTSLKCMCAAEGVCYSCKCGTRAERAVANGGAGCNIDCGTS